MILSSKARLACAGLVALSLAGCGVTPVAPNVDTPGMPNAEVALQKSLDDTAREMARIGAIEPSAAVASKPTVVAGELDRVVSMSVERRARRRGQTPRRDDRLPHGRHRQGAAGGRQCRGRSGPAARLRHPSRPRRPGRRRRDGARR